jgi:hypothetical protein
MRVFGLSLGAVIAPIKNPWLAKVRGFVFSGTPHPGQHQRKQL